MKPFDYYDIVEGSHFLLCRDIDRFPDFRATSGITGEVITIDESGVWCRMHQHIPGAEHWDNQIHWVTLEDFTKDTVPTPGNST